MTRFAGSVVALAWDPVPGASYQVFRKRRTACTATRSPPSSRRQLRRRRGHVGNTYSYVVRASWPGGVHPVERGHPDDAAQLVQVTWRVRVPANTPAADTVFMPGSLPELGPWDPGKVAMVQVEPGIWEVTVPVMEGTLVQYRYTRGTWEKVEHWGEITGITSRWTTITYGTTGAQLVDDTSLDPATPDAHESVRAWIDIPAS